MSFIEKHDPVILNIKLTSEGRKRISEGNFNVDKIALGDSEIDYEFIRENDYEPTNCSILTPLDRNPNIISFIKESDNTDDFIKLSNIISNSYIIDNSAIERGYFNSFTDDDVEINTTPEYVRQHNCVVRLKDVVGTDSLRLRKGSGLTITNEPLVGDYIMIRWTNPNTTLDDKIEFDKPHPILFYKVEEIISGKLLNNNLIVRVDRNLPNFNNYSSNKEAKAIIYPYTYNYFDYNSTNFLGEAIFGFFENYNIPKQTVPIWNMSLIFKNDIIGVNNTLKSFSKSNSASYTGFLNYIQNHTNNINMVGIIHFTNQSPSNDYGEGFYLDTPKIKLPTIMWHKSEKMGLILKADSNEHYINGLNISYRNLINDEGYVFGKVFNNLKLFVIEDAELLFAMSYKSNRNWTLPKINSDINSNIMFSDTPVCNLLYTMIVQQPQSISNQIGSITISNIIPTSDTADVIAILTNTSNNTQKTISSTFNNNYNNIVFDNLTPATYSLQVIDLTTTNCIKTETIIINQLSSTNQSQYIFNIDTNLGNDSTFKLALQHTNNYDFVVDWGDGTSNHITTHNDINKTHTYSSHGQYTIILTGVVGYIGRAIGYEKKITSVEFNNDGELKGVVLHSSTNLTSFITKNNEWCKDFKSMAVMFYNCTLLRDLDVSNWDVSRVTNMTAMFGFTNLRILDVSNWDVWAVNDMHNMFEGCSILQSLDVSNWDVSRVTNMHKMFWNCADLQSLDVSNWDVSNVTYMDGMFAYCYSLVGLDISNWNISKVTDMGDMFRDSPAIVHNYDDVLNNWSQLDVRENVIFNAGFAKYSDVGEEARSYLIDVKGWTITDNGGI